MYLHKILSDNAPFDEVLKAFGTFWDNHFQSMRLITAENLPFGSSRESILTENRARVSDLYNQFRPLEFNHNHHHYSKRVDILSANPEFFFKINEQNQELLHFSNLIRVLLNQLKNPDTEKNMAHEVTYKGKTMLEFKELLIHISVALFLGKWMVYEKNHEKYLAIKTQTEKGHTILSFNIHDFKKPVHDDMTVGFATANRSRSRADISAILNREVYREDDFPAPKIVSIPLISLNEHAHEIELDSYLEDAVDAQETNQGPASPENTDQPSDIKGSSLQDFVLNTRISLNEKLQAYENTIIGFVTNHEKYNTGKLKSNLRSLIVALKEQPRYQRSQAQTTSSIFQSWIDFDKNMEALFEGDAEIKKELNQKSIADQIKKLKSLLSTHRNALADIQKLGGTKSIQQIRLEYSIRLIEAYLKRLIVEERDRAKNKKAS